MSQAEPLGVENIPESNLDQITLSLSSRIMDDLDNTELVNLLRMLVARAEELQGIHRRSKSAFDSMMVPGNALPDQSEFDAQALEPLFETSCLEWFISRMCKQISQQLEFNLHFRFGQTPRIQSVIFRDDGSVESYKIEPASNAP